MVVSLGQRGLKDWSISLNMVIMELKSFRYGGFMMNNHEHLKSLNTKYLWSDFILPQFWVYLQFQNKELLCIQESASRPS